MLYRNLKSPLEKQKCIPRKFLKVKSRSFAEIWGLDPKIKYGLFRRTGLTYINSHQKVHAAERIIHTGLHMEIKLCFRPVVREKHAFIFEIRMERMRLVSPQIWIGPKVRLGRLM